AAGSRRTEQTPGIGEVSGDRPVERTFFRHARSNTRSEQNQTIGRSTADSDQLSQDPRFTSLRNASPHGGIECALHSANHWFALRSVGPGGSRPQSDATRKSRLCWTLRSG